MSALVLAALGPGGEALACRALLADGGGVVLCWPGDAAPGARLPARRAAAGAARDLAEAGLDALASGALVRVALPPSPAAAAAAVQLALAADAGPVALVVAGPRPAEFEPFVASAGTVLAAGGSAPLEACLRAELGARLHVQPSPGPLAAVLARAGAGVRRARVARTPAPDPGTAEAGQAAQLLLAGLLALVTGALALGLLGAGLGAHGRHQRAADLAALAGARALVDLRPLVLGPAAGPSLLPAAYRARAVRVAHQAARRNGASDVVVRLEGGELPARVRVVVRDRIAVGPLGSIAAVARATAEAGAAGAVPGDGDYPGPFARRDGRPMRPDVALAYDRLARAAARDGHRLVVVSGFRSSSEQARLFAARPDPRWVARPGTSLHRLGTELDLGPPSAYHWLGANAGRFGFLVRYAWEPWHLGFGPSPASTRLGYGDPGVPAWVPAAYRDELRRASARHGVGAALLAAQLQQESGFDPQARSPAGALGIAQFIPGTAARYGLSDPFDPAAAIDAQARLMRDLLGRFGAVPLALAAYTAGPGPVAACGCVPAITETQRNDAAIVALLGGAGAGGPPVRLIE